MNPNDLVFYNKRNKKRIVVFLGYISSKKALIRFERKEITIDISSLESWYKKEKNETQS